MPRASRWAGRAALGLGLLAWAGVPVAVITAATGVDAGADIAPVQQTWVPVRENDTATVVDVEIDLSWEASPGVVAPAWAGTVTSVVGASGGSLVSGAQVAEVDGIMRLAVHTDEPFWRSLALGDTGRDAQHLNRYLAGAGFPAAGGSTVTDKTVTGVQRLSVTLGFPKADPAAVFDPAWFVYLPDQEVPVGASSLVLGAPAPAAGEVLAAPVTLLTGGSLAVSGTTPADQGAVGTGDPASGTAPPAPTAAGGGALGGAGVGVPTSAAEDQEVFVASTPLELEEDRTTLTRGALDLLEAQVDTATPVIAARLSSPPGPGEFLVPPAAVFTGASSATCVRTRTPGGVISSVPVTVVADSASGSVVSGGLDAGMSVEVGVGPGDRTCTS